MTARGAKMDLLVIRLAAEGVPVKAIARAMFQREADVHLVVAEAYQEKRLRAMPATDWSDRRLIEPAIPPLPLGDILPLAGQLQWALHLTPAEARFLSALMTFGHIDSPTLAALVSPKASIPALKVHATRLRKKLRWVIIRSRWGTGYSMPADCRDQTLAVLEQKQGGGRRAA